MLCQTDILNPKPNVQGNAMRRLSFGVLLIALSTLVLELMLTRVFDVTLTPNLSYFVVSLAVFSFGLAGIYATLRPIPVEEEIRGRLVGCSVGFAGAVLLLRPIINALPLDYLRIVKSPDLNFMIPEMATNIKYTKGTYYADRLVTGEQT